MTESFEFDTLTSEQKTKLRILAESCKSFTSDSRAADSRSIFVALKGQTLDGHDFIDDVLARGTQAVVAQTGLVKARSPAVIEVDSTQLAHRFLAACFRKKFKGCVVAVGGSSGKTSTKEFLATLLSAKFKVLKTEKSQNGDLGIPRTLERLNNNFEVAVIEVGIDAPGDMIRHAHIVAPNLSVLTSIGEEHLNLLKTVENVYCEEKILFDVTLSLGGQCFAPLADAYLSRLKDTPGVHLVNRVDLDALVPFNHPYAKQNARLAIAVATQLGVSAKAIKEALKDLELPEGRGRTFKVGALEVIADHYNANPSSLEGALKYASELAVQDKRNLILVLGDMLDLGESTKSAHQNAKKLIESAKANTLWLVGPEMSGLAQSIHGPKNIRQFANSVEAAKKISELKSESGLLLLKGSRGMKLELILDPLLKQASS